MNKDMISVMFFVFSTISTIFCSINEDNKNPYWTMYDENSLWQEKTCDQMALIAACSHMEQWGCYIFL